MPVYQADWNSDGTKILTQECITEDCSKYRVQVWDAATSDPLVELDHATQSIWSANWSKNESLILTRNRLDQTVRIWDADTGNELKRIFLPGEVCQAMWSDDESLILANGFDTQYIRTSDDCFELETRTYVLDAVTGEEMFSIKGDNPVSKSDSTIMMVTSEDEIRQYFTSMEDLLNSVCDQSPRNMNHREWLRVWGTQPYTTTCSSSDLPIHPSVIDSISDAGKNLIIAGEIDEGLAQIQQALEATLHSDLIDDSLTESQQLAAAILVEEGRELAQLGRVEEALRLFQQALDLDRTLEIDPYKEAHRWDAIRLVNQGQELAQTGDIDGAIAKFREAKRQDPVLVLNDSPEYIKLHTANYWINESFRSLSEYQDELEAKALEEAINNYNQAKQLAPNLSALSIRDRFWNSLCWHGTVNGFATDVLDACEQAVAMRPNWGPAYGSRGIAYTLTGDEEGAISDFKVAVAWWQENDPDQDWHTQINSWIIELESGGEPFGEDTLEKLRY